MRVPSLQLSACVLLFVSLTARADIVADWADTTTEIATDGPNTVRTMALAQGAVYEAVNAIVARYPQDRAGLGAPKGASVEAAVAAASRAILLHEAPALKERTEAAYSQALGKIAEGEPRTQGSTSANRPQPTFWGSTPTILAIVSPIVPSRLRVHTFRRPFRKALPTLNTSLGP